MTQKQRLVIIILGVVDIVVIGCLIAVVLLTPRWISNQSPPVPTETPSPAPSPTSRLRPTWTPTPSPPPASTPTPFATSTSVPTLTPATFPTNTPIPPTPLPPSLLLENAGFEGILPDQVPGWQVTSVINWQPGDEFQPETSYAEPRFKRADDPQRYITGSTLQIESGHQYVKFKTTLYQIAQVSPGSQVQFETKARGFSSEGGIYVRVGIDPAGRPACEGGLWGEMQLIDQGTDLVVLRSPEGIAGADGQLTVCIFAEPQYAVVSKAAFFDDALLTVIPPD